MLKTQAKLALGTAALLAALAVGYAADEPPKADKPPERGERGGRGGGGGGGGGDWRQQMEDQLKADLGATEDEWKLLKPRLDKATEARRNSMGGMFGGRGRGGPGGGGPGGGGPGGGGDRPQSEVVKASEDLNKTLEDKAASADAIKTKLTALRAAREKAKQDLTKAQGELKEVLTARQEAVLVARGVLE